MKTFKHAAIALMVLGAISSSTVSALGAGIASSSVNAHFNGRVPACSVLPGADGTLVFGKDGSDIQYLKSYGVAGGSAATALLSTATNSPINPCMVSIDNAMFSATPSGYVGTGVVIAVDSNSNITGANAGSLGSITVGSMPKYGKVLDNQGSDTANIHFAANAPDSAYNFADGLYTGQVTVTMWR
jgi:hypothetical protein